jgi:hypothetical protein
VQFKEIQNEIIKRGGKYNKVDVVRLVRNLEKLNEFCKYEESKLIVPEFCSVLDFIFKQEDLSDTVYELFSKLLITHSGGLIKKLVERGIIDPGVKVICVPKTYDKKSLFEVWEQSQTDKKQLIDQLKQIYQKKREALIKEINTSLMSEKIDSFTIMRCLGYADDALQVRCSEIFKEINKLCYLIAEGSLDNVTNALNSLTYDINFLPLQDGKTPLHLAIELNKLEIAKLLLVKGADVNVENHLCVTPLDLAKSLNNKDMVALLDKYINKPGAQATSASAQSVASKEEKFRS